MYNNVYNLYVLKKYNPKPDKNSLGQTLKAIFDAYYIIIKDNKKN